MQYVGKEDDKMSRAIEIYPYRKAIARALESIGRDPYNSQILLKHYNERIAQGISPARIYKCLSTLKIISKMLGKPFEGATKDDIIKLVAEVESRDISGWTKRDYKIILKHFYKWLRNCEDGMPPEVRWIKRTEATENRHPILPKHLLTPEEKTAMLRAALNSRDRALLDVFFESGRRPGEILTLHIKDIEFDSVGAKLFIHGKVGEDFARIISSTPSLKQWLLEHPLADDPESPVWIGFGRKNALKQITHAAANAIVKNMAERAGVKKRVFYYLFRHTRVDETQGILTEPQQCMMFGWKFGSRMPAVYMKRYGKHIDNAQSIMNGINTSHAKVVTAQKPQTCLFCKTENSSVSKFCYNCGKSLEIKFGVEVEDREKKIKEMLHTIITDPQELENLRKYLSERHYGKA